MCREGRIELFWTNFPYNQLIYTYCARVVYQKELQEVETKFFYYKDMRSKEKEELRRIERGKKHILFFQIFLRKRRPKYFFLLFDH